MNFKHYIAKWIVVFEIAAAEKKRPELVKLKKI